SAVGISKTWWNYIWVNEPALEKNKWMQFKSIGEIAEKQGKRVIDAFLDLVVEEKLETRFLQAENNIDDEALSKILTHPNAEIGHDFPAGGWRIKETAEGVSHTIVNGQILLENKKHTGALPGRVLRNTWYHANRA